MKIACGRRHSIFEGRQTLDRLTFFHDDGDTQVNVFVHGYSPFFPYLSFSKLISQFKAIEPRGKCYLFYWKSGEDSSVLEELFTNIPEIAGFRNSCKRPPTLAPTTRPMESPSFVKNWISHYRRMEKRADQLGRGLLRRLAATNITPTPPITLWGHSLGARLIHRSLSFSKWEKYNLRNVVLMAGATDSSDSENWKVCASKVRGRIFNCMLDHDAALYLKKSSETLGLSFERCIGHTPIDSRIKNISNIRFPFGFFGHCGFTAELSRVARKTVPHAVGSPHYRPTSDLVQIERKTVPHCRVCDLVCPNELCEAELTVTSYTPWRCPECGIVFLYDHREARCYYEEYPPPKYGRCQWCGERIMIQESALYECSECGKCTRFLRTDDRIYVER
jgi:DNA-directed RNA polymerase subunit RPC12/RpoP